MYSRIREVKLKIIQKQANIEEINYVPILGSFSAGRLKNLPYSPPPGLGRLVKMLLKACLLVAEAEANTQKQVTNVNLH